MRRPRQCKTRYYCTRLNLAIVFKPIKSGLWLCVKLPKEPPWTLCPRYYRQVLEDPHISHNSCGAHLSPLVHAVGHLTLIGASRLFGLGDLARILTYIQINKARI